MSDGIVVDANKGIAISFSNLEKTIQAENGQQVSLKEMSDGTLYLQTKDALYVTQVRPQSQLVEQLVEKYNITYKYANQNQYRRFADWRIIHSITYYIVRTHKKGKIGIGASAMKNSASKATPLPDITLKDIGGLPVEMKEEIHQTLSIVKNPKQSRRLGLTA